jgi:hypothetical protein
MRRQEALELISVLLSEWGDDGRSVDPTAVLAETFVGDDATGYLPASDDRELQLLIGRYILRSMRVPAAVDCPRWCALEDGHPFDPAGPSEPLERTHERSFGEVDVVQVESAAGPAGPIERTSAIALWAGDNANSSGLSAAQCRLLAADLVAAAELLDLAA